MTHSPRAGDEVAAQAPPPVLAMDGDELDGYSFPKNKFISMKHAAKRDSRHRSQDKVPLVLVACGSFSPITFLHLRLFELAKDWTKYPRTEFEVVAGYLSPVGDAYSKAGLATAKDRIHMCQLALEADADSRSSWVMVDDWEARHTEYQPTARVLDHFNYEINTRMGGVEMPDGSRRTAKIVLLAGADLISTMSTPGVWSQEDLQHILGDYGAFIVERAGTNIDDALASLEKWKSNIHVIHQLIQNDVSSTKIRAFLKKDMSIRYLVPQMVIEYIEKKNLYTDAQSRQAALNGEVAAS
ncbi:Nucleotidylyl transferase [Eremomyces bilateralis CBS 781.70]|uniref:Nicotinamide-nucleotide adenylyltransferase n=1 Tax=Eremomyces bilateralis CBS 781.70 TaxID=1392243 RepID=A0A6G1FVR7_9PEZI|nr:Nucleotidylyl transferase [Eremomyces bilateralis CBS 781.70]KAF1809808.1 Nucleotidylyl transferase [Eremomyces bilateralis CBS 781.70]